jgi:hypothetical protein
MVEAFICGGYACIGCVLVGGLILFLFVEVAMLGWGLFGWGTKHDDDKRGRA